MLFPKGMFVVKEEAKDKPHIPEPEKVQKTLGVEWMTRAPKEPPVDYVPLGDNIKEENPKGQA